MSFFGLFQKKKEEVKKIKKVDLTEISKLAESEWNQYQVQTKEIKQQVREIENSLVGEIENHIQTLKSINVDERKEHERIKQIVKENIFYYIAHLERVIRELEKEDIEDSEKYIASIQSIMNTFQKNSLKSYEKATILIGKELEDVQISIRTASQKIGEIVQKNQPLFEKGYSIERLKEIVKELEILTQMKKNSEESIKSLEKKERDSSMEKMILEKKLKEYKESSEYAQMVEKEKEIEAKKEELTKDIFKIKEKINLKTLAKYYYGNIKKSALIRAYQDDFIKALESDASLEIVVLTKEATTKDIEEEITRIKTDLPVLKKSLERESEKQLLIFENKIRASEEGAHKIAKAIEEENKKLSKFTEKQIELTNDLNKKANELFGEIELQQ